MRPLLALAALLAFGPASAAQRTCDTLLSAAEIRSTCGVPGATVDYGTSGDDRCHVTAQRDGAVSGLTVAVYPEASAEVAAATVALARALGESAGGGGGNGEADRAIGQVFEMLGAQDADAPAAEAVSAEEGALRELPDLGDGGVRYVSSAASALGLVTHTVVFSDGATVVKLESGIAAGRAGVCTVDGLEVLARRVAGRL